MANNHIPIKKTAQIFKLTIFENLLWTQHKNNLFLNNCSFKNISTNNIQSTFVLYCRASAICADSIFSESDKSAIVLDTFKMR